MPGQSVASHTQTHVTLTCIVIPLNAIHSDTQTQAIIMFWVPWCYYQNGNMKLTISRAPPTSCTKLTTPRTQLPGKSWLCCLVHHPWAYAPKMWMPHWPSLGLIEWAGLMAGCALFFAQHLNGALLSGVLGTCLTIWLVLVLTLCPMSPHPTIAPCSPSHHLGAASKGSRLANAASGRWAVLTSNGNFIEANRQ